MMTTIEAKPKSTSITKTALFIITFFIFVKAAESAVIHKGEMNRMINNNHNINITSNFMDSLHNCEEQNFTIKEELLGIEEMLRMEQNITRRRVLVILLADYINESAVGSKKTSEVLQLIFIAGMIGNICLLIALFAMKTTQVVQNW